MPDSIIQATLREITPLKASDSVEYALRRVIDEDLPGLPVVNDAGGFLGIFGEREFIEALFPGYVGTLHSAAMVSRDADEVIERRLACRDDRVADHLTTDYVLVEESASDTQLAELFLHHRVLLIPIAREGRVTSIVTRADFFRSLGQKMLEQIEDYGD